MGETWEAIRGFEGLYEVSDQGNVRTYRVQGSSFKRRREPQQIAPNRNRFTGYLYIRLYRYGGHNGKHGVRHAIHRLVLETFVGPCPAGYEALHCNGEREDNRLVNLRWDTHEANMKDRKKPRRTRPYPLRGERHHRAVLTDEQVAEIRRLRGDGARLVDIAALFGTSTSNVSKIARGMRR